MADGEVSVSSEPVVSAPAPISVEPRVAAPAEAAEVARQAEEAKLPKEAAKEPVAKAEPEKAKPLSTREALRAAREKVEAEPVVEKASPLKADPKAAEPVAAKEAPAKAAEPAAKAEPVKDAPKVVHGADGKFVSADPTKAAEAATKAAEPAKAAEAKAAALPSHTAEPPPARFSAAAKERWAEAPDEVRAEAVRMEKEFTAGFAKYKTAAERDADITEFHERATKGGTTVKQALVNYVGMEDMLRNEATRDKGFEALFQNIGISPREWAAKVLNQAPDAMASAADTKIRDLEAKIARLEQGVGTITQEREQTRTQGATELVTKFASENPRFEELADDIANFMTPVHDAKGNLIRAARTKDLAEAYSLAERLNPAPQKEVPAPVASFAPAAPTATITTLVPPAAAQNRDAGTKSIAGAPTAGSDPARKQPSSTIREALRRAQQRAG